MFWQHGSWHAARQRGLHAAGRHDGPEWYAKRVHAAWHAARRHATRLYAARNDAARNDADRQHGPTVQLWYTAGASQASSAGRARYGWWMLWASDGRPDGWSDGLHAWHAAARHAWNAREGCQHDARQRSNGSNGWLWRPGHGMWPAHGSAGPKHAHGLWRLRTAVRRTAYGPGWSGLWPNETGCYAEGHASRHAGRSSIQEPSTDA
mmetsp:Transcript_23173/g.53299  ORF Transcript_23173/g.53299 Transcript_23173/m.53299 type:complete len:207 (+) Transcript_23173:293-913(+)